MVSKTSPPISPPKEAESNDAAFAQPKCRSALDKDNFARALLVAHAAVATSEEHRQLMRKMVYDGLKRRPRSDDLWPFAKEHYGFAAEPSASVLRDRLSNELLFSAAVRCHVRGMGPIFLRAFFRSAAGKTLALAKVSAQESNRNEWARYWVRSIQAGGDAPEAVFELFEKCKTGTDRYELIREFVSPWAEGDMIAAIGEALQRIGDAAAIGVGARPGAVMTGGVATPEEEETAASTTTEKSMSKTTTPTITGKTIDPSTVKVPVISAEYEKAIDAMLGVASMPKVSELVQTIANLKQTAIEEADAKRTALLKAATAVSTATVAITPTGGGIPEGKVVSKPAAAVFGVASKLLSFDVPTFEWDAPHPHVPAIDNDYVFRVDQLISVLNALIRNQRPWVWGHTGTGKSTLIEQVAARLGWPVMRINFDSEITRTDLMGRDTLVADPKSGHTTTKFVQGILPDAISGPYILLLDEIDFVRPDVSYVLQRALEGNGLLLTEDGGRYVAPHPMSRIVATANTCGQGDEHGMYQGARPQSMAFLDRFTTFIHMPYLSKAEERALVVKRHPALPGAVADKLAAYAVEHRQAFTNGEIMQPLSPRGMAALGEQFTAFSVIYGNDQKALDRAFEDVIVGRSSSTDGAVIRGIMNRVLKAA